MKRFYSSLIVLPVLAGFALTAQAQAGRVRSETRSPADAGPFSESINKPTEPKVTKQEPEKLTPGRVRVELPEVVNGERIYRLREVDSRAIIMKKPEAVFAREARKHQIEGTVVLQAIFTSTGEVKVHAVIFGLPYGLTENAIKAARKMKFKPAMKDDRAVSMWAQLEYTFTVY